MPPGAAPGSRGNALTLTIGTLATATGCAVDTIRYYERAGLLAAPPRSPGGHRQYGEADRRRLLLIRRSRELGFSLATIRDLLVFADRRVIDCASVRAVAGRHLEGLERQIRSLDAWRATLERLITACAEEGGPSCPLLEALAGELDPRGRARPGPGSLPR